MTARLGLILVAIAVGLTGCSSAPTGRQLAQDAAAAMGGVERLQDVRTLAMRGGEGMRTRRGATRTVADAEEPAQLVNVVETLDLANGRAAMSYDLVSPDFKQTRQEVLTKKGDALVGLENIPGRPLTVTSPSGLFSWGTQNSPDLLLRRNVITIALAAASAAPEETPQDRSLNGRMLKASVVRAPWGEEVTVFFEPESQLLAGFEALDTETMLGDVRAEYILSDHRAVDGITLPHKITIRKDGQPYSEVQFASIAVNDPAADDVFAIPDAANAEADTAIAAGEYSPVTLAKIADGLYHARAYSHHSMVVEFPTWLAIVEGPYTEAQSHTLMRVLQEQFPSKPVRYVAVTHHHYDHTGGVRGLAAYGATILVEKGHEPALRMIVETPHTNPADALEMRRQRGEKVGAIEVFEGMHVLSDGGQSLELYTITGNPHVDPKVLAYVPRNRALFQSDLYVPGVGAPSSPAAAHLLESVRKLNLRVDTNVGGHGGAAPFAELVKAAASVSTN